MKRRKDSRVCSSVLFAALSLFVFLAPLSLIVTSGIRGGVGRFAGRDLTVAVTGRSSGVGTAVAAVVATVVVSGWPVISFQLASAALRRSSLASSVANFGPLAAPGAPAPAGFVIAAHAQSSGASAATKAKGAARRVLLMSPLGIVLNLMKGKRSRRIILKNRRRAIARTGDGQSVSSPSN